MEEASRHRTWISQQSEEQRTARKRMALFPEASEVLFVASDIWVVRNIALFFAWHRALRYCSLWFEWKASCVYSQEFHRFFRSCSTT